MVLFSRNPVRAVLFLVLAFFASSVLWMLIQAEFLALVLIFVYVGAVMTLFLFVVMMLNIDLSRQQEKFVRFLPFAFIDEQMFFARFSGYQLSFAGNFEAFLGAAVRLEFHMVLFRGYYHD